MYYFFLAPFFFLFGLRKEQYLDSQGLNWTSIRPVYIYGPLNYNPVERYFFDRVTRGRPVCIPYDGKYITQLGHCEDLADFMIKCILVSENFQRSRWRLVPFRTSNLELKKQWNNGWNMIKFKCKWILVVWFSMEDQPAISRCDSSIGSTTNLHFSRHLRRKVSLLIPAPRYRQSRGQGSSLQHFQRGICDFWWHGQALRTSGGHGRTANCALWSQIGAWVVLFAMRSFFFLATNPICQGSQLEGKGKAWCLSSKILIKGLFV